MCCAVAHKQKLSTLSVKIKRLEWLRENLCLYSKYQQICWLMLALFLQSLIIFVLLLLCSTCVGVVESFSCHFNWHIFFFSAVFHGTKLKRAWDSHAFKRMKPNEPQTICFSLTESLVLIGRGHVNLLLILLHFFS